MTISSAIRSYVNVQPVFRPPNQATYAPSFSQDFAPRYSPAAIVILSEAARNWLKSQPLS